MKTKPVIRVLRMAALVYVGFVGLLFFTQRNLIFLPSRTGEEQGRAFAARQGLQVWEHEGTFHGWKDPGEGDAAILIFHGNAGAAFHRDYFRDLFRGLERTRDHAIYILEYPGYGFRGGRPSEAAFREAAAAAHALLAEQYASILLVGESLGSGMATWVAGEKGADGVLLVTPFRRLADVAAHHHPWVPVRWLLHDRFENDRHLENFPGPVAFVVAGRDGVIPPHLARALYTSFDGPKLWRLQEDADHNSIYYGPGGTFWAEVMSFLLPHP